jgi:hypothetical protein
MLTAHKRHKSHTCTLGFSLTPCVSEVASFIRQGVLSQADLIRLEVLTITSYIQQWLVLGARVFMPLSPFFTSCWPSSRKTPPRVSNTPPHCLHELIFELFWARAWMRARLRCETWGFECKVIHIHLKSTWSISILWFVFVTLEACF